MKSKSLRIIKMVEKGVQDKEIMATLGIKSKSSLLKTYYGALVEVGSIQGIVKRDSRRKTKTKDKILTVGKGETILLGKSTIVGWLGFKKGDKFRISKTRNGISLRKL